MKTFSKIVALIALMAVAVSCKKEFDSPPVRTLPTGEVLPAPANASVATVRFTPW
jgi:hypothetical protein